MSKEETHKLILGRPALLEDEINAIVKGKKPSLDVLVVGMNPSLSQWTYIQLYNRLKKRDAERGLREVLDQLSHKGGEDIEASLNDKAHWDQWVEETFSSSNAKGKKEALSKLQYYFLEGKEKPECAKISWPVVTLMDNLSTCKTIDYFDTIRRTLAAGLMAMESNSQRSELTWYQIDLFHDQETIQDVLLKTKGTPKQWHIATEDVVTAFWKQVKTLNPKVLLVANANVPDLIFTNYDQVLKETFNFGSGPGRQGFGKTLLWDVKSFTLQIDQDGFEQIPKVVFSRQLTVGASNSMLYYVAKEIGRMLSPME
jgi:hypothetical protein